jgi:hypothetical protein
MVPPPAMPDEAIAGVAGVLRSGPQSCLIQALVRQRTRPTGGREISSSA